MDEARSARRRIWLGPASAQEAVDAGRTHHQWPQHRLGTERFEFSADIIKMLAMGHTVAEAGSQGAAQVIVFN